jgi:hypothetical protein
MLDFRRAAERLGRVTSILKPSPEVRALPTHPGCSIVVRRLQDRGVG